MRVACICPVCGRAFYAEKDYRITCSKKCSDAFAHKDKAAKEYMIAEAEKKRRPARTDCRAYDPKYHDCDCLNALWCEVEDCKFYDPKEADNG